jgi:hypothetical protein
MIATMSEEAVAPGVQFVVKDSHGQVIYAVQMDTTYWAALGKPRHLRVELYMNGPATTGEMIEVTTYADLAAGERQFVQVTHREVVNP